MSDNEASIGNRETSPPSEEHGLSEYVPETIRKPGEIGFSCLWILLGILGWYFALEITSETYSSPSVFPKIASTIIIVCGLISLLKAIKRAPPAPGGDNVFQYLLPKDVLVILSLLLVYCIVLPHLHFIASSYLFMVIGMIYLHRGKSIVRSLIYSAIALLLLVLVFRYLFLVILP